MSSLKPNDDGDGNGITAIKNESIVSECGGTTRRCPKCGTALTYSTVGNRNLADRKKNLCRKCTFTGRHPSEKSRQKMSVSQRGRKHHEKTLEKMRGNGNGMYGVHRYNNLNPFYGKRHDDEARRKMRVAACLRVISLQRASNGRVNNVGKAEGAYFAKLEQEMGWDGVYYAKCGSQHFVDYVGYFVDYYEPYFNIVVEYDEPRHYRHDCLREKDLVRMEQIKAHLGCEFWRYNSYRKELIRYGA